METAVAWTVMQSLRKPSTGTLSLLANFGCGSIQAEVQTQLHALPIHVCMCRLLGMLHVSHHILLQGKAVDKMCPSDSSLMSQQAGTLLNMLDPYTAWQLGELYKVC